MLRKKVTAPEGSKAGTTRFALIFYPSKCCGVFPAGLYCQLKADVGFPVFLAKNVTAKTQRRMFQSDAHIGILEAPYNLSQP